MSRRLKDENQSALTPGGIDGRELESGSEGTRPAPRSIDQERENGRPDPRSSTQRQNQYQQYLSRDPRRDAPSGASRPKDTARGLPIDDTTSIVWTTAAANQLAPAQDVRTELASLRAGPEAPPPLLTDLPSIGTENQEFRLTIRQQPTQGRLCGLGSKDKRPLDPLPILQLRILRQDGTEDHEAHNSPNLMLHASVKKIDSVDNAGTEAELLKSNDGAYPVTRMLEGRLMASANVARDLDGSKACFFVFTDLSIRQEGRFRLCFRLVVLGLLPTSKAVADVGGGVVAEVITELFTVYSPRHFPGMTESTELAKCLARQGIQVPIRNDVRKRAEQAGTNTTAH